MHVLVAHSKVEPTSNVDLTLKLAPPKDSNGGRLTQLNKGKAPMQSEDAPRFLPPVPSYISSISSFDLGGTANDELPSMFVTGCTNCLIYMTVFKTNLKCPFCKKHALVAGKFLGNPAKRIRRE
ncbi:hypothetical protein L195_g036616 [Trifolium pratense]|uniref:Uncharacterized protein n=1 Tax=Trifolium pratense TaxID=57577 RepID=A0A2K3LQ02_TRIPR|nr:hypothetical protein L195_g036616 [Trifolium pratense]